MRSQVRIIAGTNAADAPVLRAGVEIALQPGWHTYWRYPGDAGVPPTFDFAASDNVKRVDVSWPAPIAFTDESGTSIGYKGNVVFPLIVTPKDPAKPVTLRLKLDYAVCEKLCVPEDAKAQLSVTRAVSALEPSLAAAFAAVPRKVPTDTLGVKARRVNDGAKPLVFLDFANPGTTPASVFVEGPNSQWSLPIPKPAQGAPAGRQHFGFELDGLPPGVDPKGRYDLTYTIVAGDRAFEVTAPLD